MFDKLKGLMELQKKMQQIKKELEQTTFDVASSDGSLTITMNGSQEVRDVRMAAGQEQLAGQIRDTVNRAIKRSQEIAAQKMKDASGLNLPGM